MERAALAFSLLPARYADAVSGRLSITERNRLQEALLRMREADLVSRAEAFRSLSAEVRRGVVFPRPSSHDERDCPFNPIGSYPPHRVADVMRRVAAREPLEVAVALCHLAEHVRRELWARMDAATRSRILPYLDDVHTVNRVRTRSYARDLDARLSRSTVDALVGRRD